MMAQLDEVVRSMALTIEGLAARVRALEAHQAMPNDYVPSSGGAFAGCIIVNESGASCDSRFEGDTDPNLIFTDGSTDQVGIGTSAPSSKLDVVGDIEVTGTDSFYFGDPTTNGSWRIVKNGEYLQRQLRVLGGWVDQDVIACKYETNASQSIPDATWTIVNYEDQVFDTHSRVTTGASWKWTATRDCIVFVKACMLFGTATWADGEIRVLEVYLNGARAATLERNEHFLADNAYSVMCKGSTLIEMSDGDYIDIRVYHNQGAAVAIAADPLRNYVCIFELT